MIRFTNKKGESQSITEICDSCKRHIKDLTVNDILVKPKAYDTNINNFVDFLNNGKKKFNQKRGL